jgi:hypothetical protein
MHTRSTSKRSASNVRIQTAAVRLGTFFISFLLLFLIYIYPRLVSSSLCALEGVLVALLEMSKK